MTASHRQHSDHTAMALELEQVRARFDATVMEDAGERETVTFKLPRLLTA